MSLVFFAFCRVTLFRNSVSAEPHPSVPPNGVGAHIGSLHIPPSQAKTKKNWRYSCSDRIQPINNSWPTSPSCRVWFVTRPCFFDTQPKQKCRLDPSSGGRLVVDASHSVLGQYGTVDLSTWDTDCSLHGWGEKGTSFVPPRRLGSGLRNVGSHVLRALIRPKTFPRAGVSQTSCLTQGRVHATRKCRACCRLPSRTCS